MLGFAVMNATQLFGLNQLVASKVNNGITPINGSAFAFVEVSFFCLVTSVLIMFALISPAHGDSDSVSVAQVPDVNNIYGLWIEAKKRKVAVWIDDCDEHLCGRIYWMKKPLSSNGEPKRDPHNPDETLRNRPRCGLKILSDFTLIKKSVWSEGEVYNPSDGRTYSGIIRLSKNGTLKIRGYVGISLFGKTLKWVRPAEKISQCH